MAWGIPPKMEVMHAFKEADWELLNDAVIEVLRQNHYSIQDQSEFVIKAKKKMRFAFWNLLTLHRAYTTMTILLPLSKELKFRTEYDYDSPFGIAMNDLGRQKKEINAVIRDLKLKVEIN